MIKKEGGFGNAEINSFCAVIGIIAFFLCLFSNNIYLATQLFISFILFIFLGWLIEENRKRKK